MWRALGYLRRYRGETIGALLALLCVSAANLAAPQMVRLAIDHGLPPVAGGSASATTIRRRPGSC